jgi:hypothetical protein
MLGYLLTDRDGWLAATGIALLQTAAFLRWSIATRAEPPALPNLMFAPYGRIVVLHVTIIVSGILVGMLQQPVVGALLLVALKLIFDVASVSKPSARKGRSLLLPIPRLINSRGDDAPRP